MSLSSLELFLNWMTQHTVWVNLFIFIIAMSESLLVVGLIVPGFLLMVGFGALIATGHLEFWPTTLIATAGAIAGDGLSYWLGQHYKYQLQRVWPLSRYPTLIQQGKQFFEKHGKKSVVLGRFFGPLRAIVPTIAGISNMPAKQFYVSNVLSAIIWAPLYLLPGILFGMSLQLAKEFAGQLAFLIVFAIIVVLILVHAVKTIYGWLAPQADVLSYRLIIWARKHPLIGALPDGLVNPNHPEVRAISSFGLLLILSSIALIISNHYLFNTLFLNNIDIFVKKQFLLLQHPVTTSSAYFVSLFGEHNFIFSSAALFSIWNFYIRNFKAVFFLISAALLPWLLVVLVNNFLPLRFSFNQLNYDSHLFISAITIYGFITIYFAKGINRKIGRLLYTGLFIFLSAIAFSLLYLGYTPLSSLLGQLLFAIVWVAVLGIAYRRHPVSTDKRKANDKLVAKSIASACLVLLVIIFSLNIQTLQQTVKKKNFIIGYEAWQESGWQALPVYRNDIRAFRKQPLNIQWAANENNIIETLNTSGWQQQDNTTDKYFNWVKDIADPLQLPVVRHIHDGEYNIMSFVKKLDSNRLLIIRLWRANYFTQNKNSRQPLWVGEVAVSHITQSPFLNYLTTIDNYKDTISKLTHDLPANYEIREHDKKLIADNNWDGKVILLK